MAQILSGVVGMLFGQEVSRRMSRPGALNIFNKSYTEFHENLTTLIDAMIMDPDHGKPGPVIIIGVNKKIPAEGHHMWYPRTRAQRDEEYKDSPKWLEWCDDRYTGLYKIVDRFSHPPGRTYYVGWEPKFICFYPAIPLPWTMGEGIGPLEQFRRALFSDTEKTTGNLEVKTYPIRTHRIDTTKFEPSLYSLIVRVHPKPLPKQFATNSFILDEYTRNDETGTFLISGKRGMAKTSTAIRLKKAVEQRYPGVSATLVTNFNPGQTGVDIFKLCLANINSTTPHIIIINDVDVHMEVAASDPVLKGRAGDRRFTHTCDRATFQDMLDIFASTKYLIVILTSEKSLEWMWSKQEYKSFVRTGRIHGEIQMTESDASCMLNRYSHD